MFTVYRQRVPVGLAVRVPPEAEARLEEAKGEPADAREEVEHGYFRPLRPHCPPPFPARARASALEGRTSVRL